MKNLINRFKNVIGRDESREAIESRQIAEESVILLSNTSPEEQQPRTTYRSEDVIQFSKLKEGTILRLSRADDEPKIFKWVWLIIGSNKDGKQYVYRLAGPTNKYLTRPENKRYICNDNFLVTLGETGVFTDFESDVANLKRNLVARLMEPEEFIKYEDEAPIDLIERVDVMWGGLGQRSHEKKSVPNDAQRVGFSSPLPQPT